MSLDLPEGVRVKRIPGFPDYAVTSTGEIFSFKRKVPFALKARTCKATGYPGVSLCRQGEVHSVNVHVAVATAFLGPRPEGHVVRHLDGDPGNCNLTNIAYGTYSQNEADKERHGRRTRGEMIHNSKLSAKEVLKIREMFAAGTTQSQLLVRWPIHPTSMHRVIHGFTWKHLPVPSYSGRPKKVYPKDWHPAAKLTEEEAKQIKSLLSAGKRSRKIAEDVGISYSTVRKIAQGNAWRHV